MINIVVLASGRGSNLQAIIDAIERKEIDGRITAVISDVQGALALERAQMHGLQPVTISYKEFSSKAEYEHKLLKTLEELKPDLICLAGYMRIVGAEIIKKFHNKIINIHPSLLPSFPGLHVQKKALEYGVKFSGCSVHFVDEGVDSGPIIIQAVVPVLDNDTKETLSSRILEQEHKIYPKAIQLFAKGKLKIEGRQVKWQN